MMNYFATWPPRNLIWEPYFHIPKSVLCTWGIVCHCLGAWCLREIRKSCSTYIFAKISSAVIFGSRGSKRKTETDSEEHGDPPKNSRHERLPFTGIPKSPTWAYGPIYTSQSAANRYAQMIMIRMFNFIAFVDYRKTTYLEYQSYQIRPIKHLNFLSPNTHSIIYIHQSVVHRPAQ